ncbi:MAG: hypothetical protein FD126_2874 [Elusimicrobia bacterium]|nr:MAG: hypothetical protein FD126_2874 [Elusimicrobiota bacterium]
MSEEKRRRHRSPCRIEAVLEGEEGRISKGPCRDISLLGLFLAAPGSAAKGLRCRVEITLSGKTSSVTLAMRGRVVRVAPDGLAVAFDSMDAETSGHLRNIVLVHSTDPDRVRGELGG